MPDNTYNTWTLSPLMNQRDYSEDEKTVLLHFFTNIDKNVYCARDALSNQLRAFLIWQYSRSHLCLRDRFLKLFYDAQEAYEQWNIKSDEFVWIEDLADSIRKGQYQHIEYFNQRASNFLKKRWVEYGHNSLKDADRVRFALEWVSQVFTKVVESPFPSLGDFQEKSTRYVYFGKESIIYSDSIKNSKYYDQIKKFNEKLLKIYDDNQEKIKNAIAQNLIIKENDFESPQAFQRTLNAKVFDILRYLLPSSVSTSLWASFPTRIAETHISEMLSHPLEEVRLIAKHMKEEWQKVSPWLLSRISENEFLKDRKQRWLHVANELFKNRKYPELKKWIWNEQRVELISSDNIDNIVTASILFEHSRIHWVSYNECLWKVENMDEQSKESIIDAEIWDRGVFDRMPRSIQHWTVQFQFTCDFGAYRDIQRHRASPQIRQWSTAIHWYDYPEFIDLPELKDFKSEYDEIMWNISEFARDLIQEMPFESEYISAFGHLTKTTFEMNPGQIAYVCELRTTPQWHHSYRKLFQQVYKIIKQKAPIFAKHIRVNQDLEWSRKKQEERAEQKKKNLK